MVARIRDVVATLAIPHSGGEGSIVTVSIGVSAVTSPPFMGWTFSAIRLPCALLIPLSALMACSRAWHGAQGLMQIGCSRWASRDRPKSWQSFF